MKYKEVEFKYNAENIKLSDFIELAESRNPEKFVLASGRDYFYKSNKDPNAFCRHRVGTDSNQLTFKRKTVDNNNYVRTEHNIDLDSMTSVDQIKAFCAEFDYSYNSALFKTCYVYRFDYYILVFYVCYDLDMNERGRFIEVEAKEDHNWSCEQEAWDAIVAVEKTILRELGITSKARMRKSLQEMFEK